MLTQNFNGTELAVYATNCNKRWYITVEEAAKGYGVTRSCIMNHLKEHSDDIRYGIEVSAVSIADTSSKGVTQNRRKTIIYREGVIKLGYFIRSVKAAAFRQWSTDLTVAFLDNKSMDMTELLDKLDDRINKRFDSFEQEFGATRAAQNQRFDKIEGVCRGFRDEIDELREMLNIMFTDDETEVVRSLIREVKEATSLDGRAIVGQIRTTLGVSCIYNVPYSRQIINVLKNMLNKGIKLVPPAEEHQA